MENPQIHFACHSKPVCLPKAPSNLSLHEQLGRSPAATPETARWDHWDVSLQTKSLHVWSAHITSWNTRVTCCIFTCLENTPLNLTKTFRDRPFKFKRDENIKHWTNSVQKAGDDPLFTVSESETRSTQFMVNPQPEKGLCHPKHTQLNQGFYLFTCSNGPTGPVSPVQRDQTWSCTQGR